MLRPVFRHLRGNAVAYVALFIALGGTAYAASLPADSVGTRQLQDRAVTGQKVAKDTLTGSNIRESTLAAVPNASHLGGAPASKYQRVISEACNQTGAEAISSIFADGQVQCAGTNLTQVMGGSGGASISGAHDFLAPEGLSTPTTTESAAEVASSGLDAMGDHLFVQLSTAPGANSKWTFEFIVNGVTTSLGCTIAPAATSCISTGGPVEIPPEIPVVVEAIATGTPAAAHVIFGWTDTT